MAQATEPGTAATGSGSAKERALAMQAEALKTPSPDDEQFHQRKVRLHPFAAELTDVSGPKTLLEGPASASQLTTVAASLQKKIAIFSPEVSTTSHILFWVFLSFVVRLPFHVAAWLQTPALWSCI